MAYILKHFIKTLILLGTFALCTATIESVTTTFTEKKSVATSHTTLQKVSKIKCVEKCNKEKQNGKCTLAGYDKRTKTCYLSVDDPMNVLDTEDEMIGVFFYEPPACAADGEPLLNGANPVPDSYFTASSYMDPYLPHLAGFPRLEFWTPATAEKTAVPPTFYLQVRFHVLSTVFRVAMKGGKNYVTTYRLAYSEDCLAFNNLLDKDGNNLTLPANTDKISVVENLLPTPITALCLRIHPLTWNNYPDIKVEVYGCQ